MPSVRPGVAARASSDLRAWSLPYGMGPHCGALPSDIPRLQRNCNTVIAALHGPALEATPWVTITLRATMPRAARACDHQVGRHRDHPGPSRRQVPTQRTESDCRDRPEIYHWFVGDGMVHGVRLRDGKVQVIPQSLGSAAHRDRLTGQRRQWQARRSTAV